ncbi:quinone-dependent dihydroorotate dehydrogenase [Candidatus Saccharibacteria bacterium]|nr:quinone-dependent dihydroorotate dehydrogenase [Candidatus Saccharibacteria bacterium]
MSRRAIRRITKLGYAYIAKPLLFRQRPDMVHHNLISVSKFIQHIPGLRSVPRMWRHDASILSQDIAGVHFINPIGLSAGFDKNIDMPYIMRNVGFGFMIGGSVTAMSSEGNPKPWFYRLPKTKSLVVFAGLPNKGVDYIASRLGKLPAWLFNDFPLSISVAKTNMQENVSDDVAIKDYCRSLKVLEDQNLGQMYEINISCPNTYGGEPFTTPQRLNALLAEVDRLKLSKPVFIKMPIDKSWAKFRMLLDVIVVHNVQGVTIANLLKDRTKAILSDELPDAVQGNLSGLPTQQLSTELVRKTYQAYGDRLVIIGVGGVMNAEDAYKKIKSGASLVALITGMIFEGPQLIGDINYNLERLLKEDGYVSIDEAVGVDVATKGV